MMQKRLISIVLILFIILILPTLFVYAANETSNTESYDLTVPAHMAPGETADVVLTGNWALNEVVTVTVSDSIEMVNSINKTDVVELGISFNNIEQNGNNANITQVTEQITIDEMPSVLFGNWEGYIVYQVDMTEAVRIPISVVAKDNNGTDLNATADAILGEEKDDLLDKLEQSGLVNNTDDIDLLIEVESDEFEDMAETTFDVSDIAKEGDEVIILHFDETKQEWEFIAKETVNEDGKVTADFSSYSPVGFIVIKPDGSSEVVIHDTHIDNNNDNVCDMCGKAMKIMLASCDTWYKGTTAKSDITTINIVNSYTSTKTEKESWNADEFDSGVYKAYILEDGVTLVLAGDGSGSILANKNSSGLFFRFDNVTEINGLELLDTSNITNMSFMFGDCYSLISLDVSNFDTSKVTTMNNMFYCCTNLTNLDLSNFDTSNVTNMHSMFKSSGITSLDLSNFKTSKATDIGGMFEFCRSLKILDVSNFDISNVADISYMFYDCLSLIELDLSSFDTSYVTSMTEMFYNCSSLQHIYVSNKWTTTNVESSINMFNNCSELVGGMGTTYDSNYIDKTYAHIDGGSDNPGYLTSSGDVYLAPSNTWYKGTTAKSDITTINIVDNYIPDGTEVESWNADKLNTGIYKAYILSDGITLVLAGDGSGSIIANKDSSKMFSDFTKTTEINGLPLIDTSNVTNMSHMFAGSYFNSALTSLDLSNFDTSKVTNMNGIFQYCSSLTKLDLSSFNTSNVTDMSYMFYFCTKLTVLNLSSFNTSNVTDMSGMFINCGKLVNLDLSNFNTSNVTDMQAMFTDCYNLKSLDIRSFDTSKVTNMKGMFYNCDQVNTLNLSNFNTSNVTDMSQMFFSCNSLTALDLSNFNTSKVTNMSEMFYLCPKLTILDISSFNTFKVTNMKEMFSICENLTTIYVSDEWTTENVTNSTDMFKDCWNLVGGSGTIYNANYTDKTYAYIDGDTNNPGYLTKLEAVEQLASSDTWYKGSTTKSAITTINIVDNYVPDETEIESWNVDIFSLGIYKCYILSDGVTLVLAGDNSGSIIANRNSSKVFAGFENVISINGLNILDTSKVTNMENMFADCSSLISLDLSNFNTSNVTNMSHMFYGCSALTNIDISKFNIDKVTDMSFMFEHCTSLTEIDLSNFKGSLTVNSSYMFANCTNLKTIYAILLLSFSADNSQNMFENCISLVGGSGTVYSPDCIDGSYGHLDGGENNPGYFSQKSSGGSNPCVTPDTLVLLADGTQKRIDEISYDDEFIVWDFVNGCYTTAKATIIMNHGQNNYEVMTLNFSDGTSVKTINGHGFYEADINKFIILKNENVQNYIGHNFIKQNADGYTTVELVSYNIETQHTESWSILTEYYYNCILDGMFTLTPAEVDGSPDYLMPFLIGNNLKYIEEEMHADIEKYGLYTYEEFAHLLTQNQFEILNIQNFKVSVAKGFISYEELLMLIKIHMS